jgi:hypothetical protein
MAKHTMKQKPNLFVAAMEVYERVEAQPRLGGGRAPTLGRAPMGSDTIHGPTTQKAVTQHPDRFWMSTRFSDSRRLSWNFDMRPVPLEALYHFLSNHIKNVPNGLCMRSWILLQVGLVMQSETSPQNVFPLISFYLWAISDVVAWWRTWETLGLDPQSTSLILHTFHECLTFFLIQVCTSENDNKHTSLRSINSSNVATITMI